MIGPLSAEDLRQNIPALSRILREAVEDGAGVSFVLPFSDDEAARYWQGLAQPVAEGRIILLAARDEHGLAGTVQLHRAWQPNQPHRGDVAKLLVARRCRRKGIGRSLMAALEAKALSLGLSLINFDTEAGGDADRFYRSLGYTCAGVIPSYAYSGSGQLVDTAIFWKRLEATPPPGANPAPQP